MHLLCNFICFFYHKKQINIKFYFTRKETDTLNDIFPLPYYNKFSPIIEHKVEF